MDDLSKKKEIRGLYAILDASMMAEEDPRELATDYLEGGVGILQLRDKKRTESPEAQKVFQERARQIAGLKRLYRFTFIVNDDLEVAGTVGADGVHVGENDFSIEECRKRLGPSFTIGYSAHSLEEALRAEREGADYVAFGAIYPTRHKGPGHPIQGIEKLKNVVRALRVPVVAIGGIGRDNIGDVLATQVASVAMISALAPGDPRLRRDEARFFSRLFGG